MKSSLWDYSLVDLENILAEKYQLKSYMTHQLWSWIYTKGSREWSVMSNISKNTRQLLEESYQFDRPGIVDHKISLDGTQKWLLQLENLQTIELVYIPSKNRGTLCLSTQVGCSMGCCFCNTGTQGLARNLKAAEIVAEIIVAKDLLSDWENKKIGAGKHITNLVFMGMGEPLQNYDNVVKAIKIISDPNGLAFSSRRITLSTCGLVPQILKLSQDVKVNLAVSLHATTDEIRRKLMPIAEKYNLDQLLSACKYYSENTNYSRVTFEYLLIKNFNDDLTNAKKLVQLVTRYKIPAKFNLIPFNNWDNSGLVWEPADMDIIQKFALYITKAGYPCPIRFSRGGDIMAACGQLKTSVTSAKSSS
jgi:23S rRNA (adenine2503-C2)-methyltransferase